MDTGILTTLLNTFVDSFSGGYSRISSDAWSLLSILAALEVTVAAIWWALSEENALVSFLKKTMQVGTFVFIVSNYDTLINVILESFVSIGLKAGGGGSSSIIKDPSQIVDYGFAATAPLFAYIRDYSTVDIISHLPNIIITGFAGIMVILAFFALAIQVFITYLEFFLISVLGLILVPFGVFKYTSFLAEKIFGAIISFGVRLMVLAFILTVAQPILSSPSLKLPENPDLKSILILLLTVLTVMMLSWHAPAIAGGLIAGSPSLSASTGLGMATTAVAGAIGLGLAGKAATKGISQAAIASTRAASSITGSFSSPPKIGSGSSGGAALAQMSHATSTVASLPGNNAGALSSAAGSGALASASSAPGSHLSSAPPHASSFVPEWARKLQVARMMIPKDAHSGGAGMTAPLNSKDS